MNEASLTQQLEQLQDNSWQAIADGQALLIIDDQKPETGPADASNAIYHVPETGLSTDTIKQQVLSDAAALLSNYYTTHPLTLAGFNQQVTKLFEAHGTAAFAAPTGKLPSYTLFVDGGQVIAESQDSPRHRYGIFCALNKTLSSPELEEQVRQWLERGDAHEDYLGMNVCRYNC